MAQNSLISENKIFKKISIQCKYVKVVKFENIVFLKLKLRFLAQQKTRNGVFRPPPGPWLTPLGIQIDLRVSADAVDVRNGLQQSARPQAVVDKKTEYVLLKKRSEILIPLKMIFSYKKMYLCINKRSQEHILEK